MAKRKLHSVDGTIRPHPTTGGRRLGPSTSEPNKPKRVKVKKNAVVLNIPALLPTTAVSTPMTFEKLPNEIKNMINELVYGKAKVIKVLPKRSRSFNQKAHASVLDPILVNKQWFHNSAVIFISSLEFQFECFNDFLIASQRGRLAPWMRESIKSIAWHEAKDYCGIPPDVAPLTTLYPNLQNLRIFIRDEALRWCDYKLPNGRYTWADRYLLDDGMFQYAFGRGEAGGRMRALRSLRGLKSFSWVNENPSRLAGNDRFNPLTPGRTIYECNWAAWSEWVRKEVTKPVGT